MQLLDLQHKLQEINACACGEDCIHPSHRRPTHSSDGFPLDIQRAAEPRPRMCSEVDETETPVMWNATAHALGCQMNNGRPVLACVCGLPNKDLVFPASMPRTDEPVSEVPLFTVDFPCDPHGTEQYQITASALAKAALMEKEGVIRGRIAQDNMELRAALTTAEAQRGALAEALRHMHHCADCAEGPWDSCEGGVEALAALASLEVKP